MNKPFYIYDFMVLTYSAQYSKIKLCATCFCLREDFCKDRQCLYSDIWNTRISTRNRRISPKFSSNRQLQRALREKEMVYIPGMCWEPLIKHLKTSWWLSQAACLWKGTCRERSQVFPQTMWDEVMTGDGIFMHYPQKTEVFAFLIKQKKPNDPNLRQLFFNNLVFQHPPRTNSPETHKSINSGHIAKKKYQPTTFSWWQISAISVVYKMDINAYLCFSKAIEGANSLYFFSIFIQRAAACPAHSTFSNG